MEPTTITMRPWDEGPKKATLRRAANILYNAQLTGRQGSPIDDLLTPYSYVAEGADVVVGLNLDRGRAEGRRLAGRMAGVHPGAGHESDPGYVFADVCHASGATIPGNYMTAPKVGATVAFVMDTDLEHPDTTPAEFLRGVSLVLPALSILGPRIKSDAPTRLEHIADNIHFNHVVLGAPIAAAGTLAFDALEAELEIEASNVARGGKRADPLPILHCVLTAARKSIATVGPIRAGEIVVAPQLTELLDFPEGARATAYLPGIGTAHAFHGTADVEEGFEPMTSVDGVVPAS